jgi:hypothetical protein
VTKRSQKLRVIIAAPGGEDPNHRRLWLLRTRGERPGSRTAKNRDELAPLHVLPAENVCAMLKPSTLRGVALWNGKLWAETAATHCPKWVHFRNRAPMRWTAPLRCPLCAAPLPDGWRPLLHGMHRRSRSPSTTSFHTVRAQSKFLNRINLICPVQSHLQKHFRSHLTQISSLIAPSRSTEGRLAIVTNAGRDAMDERWRERRTRLPRGRRRCVVLMPRCWHQVGGVIRR